MTFWANCSSRRALALALLLGCAGARPRTAPALQGRVAVLPLTNLSGGAAPLKELRGALESALRGRGIEVIDSGEVEEFLARHRIRWTGGVDADLGRAASRELGGAALLVASVDTYLETPPPRFGMRARLVSAGEKPEILWIDAATRTGDGAPGLFDLGLVDEVNVLEEIVLGSLADSLRALSRARACGASGRFAPRTSYRSRRFDPASASVAVLPFVNETRRRNAGDLVALEFVRKLGASGVRVLEPGLVRSELFRFRIATDQGVSLDAARVVMELLHADYVLTGTVRDFLDPSTSSGDPVAQFTVLLLDRKNNEVVWQSTSDNRGGDGVFFFDAGQVGSASDLVCRMAGSTVEAMFEGANRAPPAQVVRAPGSR